MSNTVRRVVDKLLHPPTVRFKQLAAQPDGENYAEVVRTLFDLDGLASDGTTTRDTIAGEEAS